jgi:Ca2+/Na+ antiporter
MDRTGLWLLVGAMAALYVAGRAAFDTVARLSVRPSAGRLALAQWMPIACVVLAATITRRSEVAIGVIFATSVASLSLVFGLTIFMMPTDLSGAPARRAWPLVLPAGILVLLAGFRAQFTLMHAVILLVEGIVVLLLWRDSSGEEVVDAAPTERGVPVGAIVAFALAFLLSLVGAWAAGTGASIASRDVRLLPAGLIGTVVISPALVLPMIGSGTLMAQRGQTATLVSTLVGVVLLNLLLLLPLMILCWHTTRIVDAYLPVAQTAPTTRATTTTKTATTTTTTTPIADPSTNDAPTPLIFPLANWRIDTIVLIGLGVMLVPLSTSRWQLGRLEGCILIVAYMAYLIAATRLGARPG